VATMTRNLLLHGRDEPLQELRPLRAGPLQAMLDGVDLRYVRLGEIELVRRIYVAVRDRNWNTIPGVVSEVDAREREDAFEVSFRVRHASHDTDFSWEGTISGTADGRITFRMDGHAERDMFYNRIGFCVLHPWREYRGRRFRGETPDDPVEGTLPDSVAPQRFENGVYVPLFPSVSRVTVELDGGAGVTLAFEGDLFETEDQRNWTDASLKTYCTPLALGFPHELRHGQAISQAVSVTATGGGEVPTPDRAPNRLQPRLEIGAPTGRYVPPVGLVHPPAARELTGAESRLLARLAPAHLRAEVHLDDAGWPGALADAGRAAEAIGGAQLELAVFVGETPDDQLAHLRELLSGRAVARVLVAPEGAQTTTPEETTPAALVRLVTEALGLANVPVAGGTDMYFCELNRTRPEVADMDGVFWSLNGQVHAFDDVSLLETPEAQGEQVRTARDFAPGKGIFVGPVTLRRRYNVNATVAEEETTDGLPDSVDPRQATLLGAAWTLASAKHLAEQGADAITYFETVGWRGVIEGDAEPPAPDLFPARSGQVFPLFHVLADVAELREAEILACETNRPLEVAGLAARGAGGAVTLLLANLTPRPLTIAVSGLETPASARRLNLDAADEAMHNPDQFRLGAGHEPGDVSNLDLGPYETVRIDT
jgi:D-apionolactonase